MQSHVWTTLLRQIPAEKHDCLMIMTTSRVEINLQAVLRLDADYLAIRGRLAGSQDAGRVFFIPFNHIDYLGFQREVKEAEFQEMFAGLDQVQAPEKPPEAVPATATPADEVTSSGSSSSGKTPLPIKSAILDRFRARGSAPGLPRSASNPGTGLRSLGTSNPGTNLRPPTNG